MRHVELQLGLRHAWSAPASLALVAVLMPKPGLVEELAQNLAVFPIRPKIVPPTNIYLYLRESNIFGQPRRLEPSILPALSLEIEKSGIARARNTECAS